MHNNFKRIKFVIHSELRIFKIPSAIDFENTGKLSMRYATDEMSFLWKAMLRNMSLLIDRQPDRSWLHLLSLLSDFKYSSRFLMILLHSGSWPTVVSSMAVVAAAVVSGVSESPVQLRQEQWDLQTSQQVWTIRQGTGGGASKKCSSCFLKHFSVLLQ